MYAALTTTAIEALRVAYAITMSLSKLYRQFATEHLYLSAFCCCQVP